MHQKSGSYAPNPALSYQLSSEHRLLSVLELAAAFCLANQHPWTYAEPKFRAASHRQFFGPSNLLIED
jgi:hypothetical protein